MSVQKIPLETVQKIRQYIKNTLTLPEAENHPKAWSFYEEVDELPEPESLGDLGELFNFGGTLQEATRAPNRQGRWFISSANPGATLLKLPGLRLKPHVRLITYLHRNGEDGSGVTWAVPEEMGTTSQLERALEVCGDRAHPPQPLGALPDLMDALEGDRSPASFIVASILRREMREFGAINQSCNWTHHRLIGALPPQARWQWRIAEPKDLSPKVRLFPDGKAAIEFFTCRVVAPIAIFQHVDQYPTEHYKAVCIERPVAIAQQPGVR